jgi:uncharacterized protein (TIGR00725 family)
MAMRRRAIISVVGGGKGRCPPESPPYLLAAKVGRLIAERGGILLCGGGTGVMEAAARGAYTLHRRTIAVLKEQGIGSKPDYGITICTGLGDGRNYVNAAAADAMVALVGEAGTLSEIALALKLGRPVICVQAWEFLIQGGFEVLICNQPEEAVGQAFDSIGADASGFVEAEISYPCMPDQSPSQKLFAGGVANWSNEKTFETQTTKGTQQ